MDSWFSVFFFFSFGTLNILACCLLVSKVSDEKSADLIEDPIHVMICFSLPIFKISLYLGLSKV